MKKPCVIVHCLPNDELFRIIAIDKKLTQGIELTFILGQMGYYPSPHELSDCPCQHVLRHKQGTNEQRNAMLRKRSQWIQYMSFNPTVCLSFLWARNVRMNRDPSTQKDCSKATPNNVPNRTTMRKVGAVVFCQRTVVDRRNGVRVNEGPLHQVVDKQEEQHCEVCRCGKGTG